MSIDNPTNVASSERASAGVFEIKANAADREAEIAMQKGNIAECRAKLERAAECRACAELARRMATWVDAA